MHHIQTHETTSGGHTHCPTHAQALQPPTGPHQSPAALEGTRECTICAQPYCRKRSCVRMNQLQNSLHNFSPSRQPHPTSPKPKIAGRTARTCSCRDGAARCRSGAPRPARARVTSGGGTHHTNTTPHTPAHQDRTTKTTPTCRQTIVDSRFAWMYSRCAGQRL